MMNSQGRIESVQKPYVAYNEIEMKKKMIDKLVALVEDDIEKTIRKDAFVKVNKGAAI